MTLLAEKTYARAFQGKPRRVVATPRRAKDVGYKVIWGTKSNRALTHALSQIDGRWDVGSAARGEMVRILKGSLRDDSAFATISPDGDGGLLAQWRAGRSYLTIEISDGESVFTYANAKGELEANEVTLGSLDASRIKSVLAKFTADLVEANPQWRKLFS